jgi:Holliday junction DNA helicase RuvA
MIALVSGILRSRDGDTVLIETSGGVGYSVTLPLGVVERLPAVGSKVQLHTELVVKEDGWALFGFDRPAERLVFQRLLSASGFGPRLALALLSTLGADRTVRSIRQKDIAALSTVSGIGKKKAERLVLELHDRFEEVGGELPPASMGPSEEALAALTRLGYPPAQAESAVRDALAADGSSDTAQLIKQALQRLAGKR